MPRISRRAVVFLSLSFLIPFPGLAVYGPDKSLTTGSFPDEPAPSPLSGICQFERTLLAQGLVDVQTIDPTLLVDLKYARSDNFMGRNVYGELRRCYLQPEAAQMLSEAHHILTGKEPGLRLLLVDGVRPRRVQRLMWDIVKDTPMRPYVADPSRGSMHNYGAAVDLTLTSTDGTPLDMGTGMDYFGTMAQPREEERLLREGRLTSEQIANRKFLRGVMVQAGFRPLAIEWWHFDAFAKEETRNRFAIVE
jgi:zinc D-Ala-D-Ala dipeptidase